MRRNNERSGHFRVAVAAGDFRRRRLGHARLWRNFSLLGFIGDPAIRRRGTSRRRSGLGRTFLLGDARLFLLCRRPVCDVVAGQGCDGAVTRLPRARGRPGPGTLTRLRTLCQGGPGSGGVGRSRWVDPACIVQFGSDVALQRWNGDGSRRGRARRDSVRRRLGRATRHGGRSTGRLGWPSRRALVRRSLPCLRG
jgi:hypothetical protein